MKMPKEPKPSYQNKDKLFYGWIIVISTSIITCLLMGIRYSFGIFFKSFEYEFELNRVATSSIVSLFMLFSALFGVINGWALDKYGPRILFSIWAY